MPLTSTLGRYQLLRKIAQGGMAEVYLAEFCGEGDFRKQLAVKCILPQWSDQPAFAQMLQDEAKVLVHLQHQNIVQIFELGKSEGCLYIAMEYVDGMDLRQLMQQAQQSQTPIPPIYVYWLIMEVLRALAFAHSRIRPDGTPLCIVHRDISPQNILLAWHGEVKVADFGIAKGNHRLEETAVGQLKGKYAYMSPEQACGDIVDLRSDLFSLGIIFFELLSNQRLFVGDNDLQVLEQVRAVTLPQGWEQGIAPEIRAILRKCLKLSPNDRFQSAEDMLAMLTQYVMRHQCQVSGLEFSPYMRNCFPNTLDCTPRPDAQTATAIQSPSKVAAARAPRPWPILARLSVAALGLILGTAAHRAEQPLQAVAPLPLPTPVAIAAPVAEIPASLVVAPSPQPSLSSPAVTPVVAKARGTVSVRVRPWGYVTIPGVLTRRESPVNAVSVPEGAHQIKVFHEPTHEWLSTKITVRGNSAITCFASFNEESTIKCR